MKITPAIIITGVASAWGLIAGNPFLWLPITALIAGIIDALTRDWVQSPRLGASMNLSIILKFVFTLMGTYAMLSQIACVLLMIYWVVT